MEYWMGSRKCNYFIWQSEKAILNIKTVLPTLKNTKCTLTRMILPNLKYINVYFLFEIDDIYFFVFFLILKSLKALILTVIGSIQRTMLMVFSLLCLGYLSFGREWEHQILSLKFDTFFSGIPLIVIYFHFNFPQSVMRNLTSCDRVFDFLIYEKGHKGYILKHKYVYMYINVK